MGVTCLGFIATSLDGYIARSDGTIDWLHNPKFEIPGEDFGYEEHFRNIDALVMGRNTFELATSFDKWPYTGKHVYVLSTKNLKIPDHLSTKASVLSGEIDMILSHIESKGHFRLYIDGGKTIQEFIRKNRLDEITITRIPILLGNGIPLFGSLENDVYLKHISTKSYTNGFVRSQYSMDRQT